MANNGWSYKDKNVESMVLSGGIEEVAPAAASESCWSNTSRDLLLEDIEQSHHFLVQIDKLTKYLPGYFVAPFDKSEKFLPVKSISYTEASIENMSISLGVLGSLPILYRKNLGRLTLTLVDSDMEPIEQAIRKWLDECFLGSNKYVAYLSNIIGKLTYKSYGVTGEQNAVHMYYVIPADSFTIDRSYEENGAKTMSFSVVVIGEAIG